MIAYIKIEEWAPGGSEFCDFMGTAGHVWQPSITDGRRTEACRWCSTSRDKTSAETSRSVVRRAAETAENKG